MPDTAAPDTTRPRPELDLAALRKEAETMFGPSWMFDKKTMLSLLDRIEELEGQLAVARASDYSVRHPKIANRLLRDK